MRNYFTYDAFISYRHADLDKFVAENLHKRLEAFKLPHSASRNRLEGEKTRIKRIFRDKDELPIASDLASPILTALGESEFLIVICSPRTPESIWVKREIENFISLHDRDHVLAVLIEGEPEESFPPSLLTVRKEVTLEDGTKTFEKVAVEPLAADVRGKNKRQVLKNIKSEILRLAAPMFGCSYDDLKQRHRQRKIRRILTTVIVANLILIAFGSFSTIQALRISRQAKQIQEQSNEIQKQADQIGEQYQEILVSSLNTLADTSSRLLKEGDRMKSILAAREALPASKTDTEKPLVPHAEYALANALYAYENESQMLTDRTLNHDTDVQFMLPSPSCERLMTLDSTNIATIWNATTGEVETTFITAEDNLYQAEADSFAFVSEDEIVYYADNQIKRYNFMTQETVWKTEDVYLFDFAFSADHSLLAVTNFEEIRIYDMATGSLRASLQSDAPDPCIGQEMAFSPDSKLLAFTAKSTTDDTTGLVQVLQLSSATITESIPTEDPYICSLLFTDNHHLAIAANSYIDLINDPFVTDNSGNVLMYQLDTHALAWSRHFVGQTIYTLELSLTKEPFLITTSTDTVNSLVLQDGSLMGSISFSSSIVDAVSYNNNTYGYCLTRDGNVQSINYDGGISYNIYFEANSNNIKSSVKADDYIAILPYASRQVVLYRYINNPKMEALPELSDDSYEVSISRDSSVYFVTTIYDSDSIIGYDYNTKEQLFSNSFDNSFQTAIYSGKNDQVIVLFFTDELKFFDSHTGEELKTLELPDQGFIDSYAYYPSTNQLYVGQTRGITVVDPEALSAKSMCASEELFSDLTASAFTTYDGKSFLISNRQTGMLEQYDCKKMDKPSKSLALNTNYITNLFYSDDGSQLFVVYKNRHIDVYKASDFSLLHTYTDLDCAATRYLPLNNADGDYILSNNYQGYLCTKDHEVKAYFPYFRCVDTVNQKIITHDYLKLSTIPIYDLDMLLKEADRQLNGRTLTEEERAEFYIQ